MAAHGEARVLHATTCTDADLMAAKHKPGRARVFHLLEGNDIGIQLAGVVGEACQVRAVTGQVARHVTRQGRGSARIAGQSGDVRGFL